MEVFFWVGFGSSEVSRFVWGRVFFSGCGEVGLEG